MRHLLVAPLIAALWAGSAAAYSGSSDVGAQIGGAPFERGDVIGDATAPMLPPVDLGPLPDGADVVAYTVNALGDVLFVLGHTMTLAGNVVATPRDVITYSGGSYAVAIGLAGLGLPEGVAIDALAVRLSTSAVLLSFDQPVQFMGVQLDDADVLDLFASSVLFSASAAGVPDGLDLDALSDGGGGDLVVSFDAGGQVAGIPFADEDLLRVRVPGYAWSLEADAAGLDAAWERADLDAVHLPEPGGTLALLTGTGLVAALGRRRRT